MIGKAVNAIGLEKQEMSNMIGMAVNVSVVAKKIMIGNTNYLRHGPGHHFTSQGMSMGLTLPSVCVYPTVKDVEKG